MNRRADLLLALLALIWGASFLFIKVALDGFAPTQIVAGRMVSGAAVLGVAVKFGAARYPRGLQDWKRVSILALASNVFPFALFAWGEQRVTSSLASVLNATTPLWTAVLAAAAMVPGERLSPRRGVGLLLGFAGVVVIVEPWQTGSGEVLGELACVAAAGCYGLGFVFTSRRITGRIPPLSAAVGSVTAGAAMSTVVAVLAILVTGDTPRFALDTTAAVLALGFFGTGLAYLFFFSLIDLAGPTVASTVTFAMPFVGVLLGVVVLDEHVGWNVGLGGLVVLTGILAVRRKITVGEPLEVGAG
ncbi:MAG TPA: DMT family transporter [Acidimicrobiales bacterium]|nr:DMT family transporter [Acidimicrobiales bacterium]